MKPEEHIEIEMACQRCQEERDELSRLNEFIDNYLLSLTNEQTNKTQLNERTVK